MYQVLLCTNPILRKIAKPVSQIDNSLQPLLAGMLDTMRREEGVGLAAPQIGISQQVVVIELPEQDPRFLINPSIYWHSEEKTERKEGCLSVPEAFGLIERPSEIKLTFYDEAAAFHDLHATDFLACVLQHEIDHLNGKLYIDYLSPLKRNLILSKIKKLERSQQQPAEA